MEVVKNILSDEQRGCDGLKVMVMAEGDLQEFLVNGLLDLNCKVYVAKSEEDAIQKLRFHSFHIVVFQENCYLQAMQTLQSFPMNIRRYIFSVFVGSLVETFSMMQAYVLSCNLVINIQDIQSFKDLLTSAIDENKTFYRAYNYTLENHYQKG